MDFRWSAEQEQHYQRILSSTREKLNRPRDEPTGGGFWSRDQWRICGQLGLLGLSVPKRYGGQGFDALTAALAIEAFGRGCEDMGLVFSAAAHLFACAMPVSHHASEEVKGRTLPLLCSGEWVGGNGVTEREAGSDVATVRTRAVPDGDGYRLTGSKSYVSNSPVADLFVIYANSDPGFGWLGVSAFLVEAGRPGLRLGPAFSKMGLESCPASEIVLDQCWVPQENRLGSAGQGMRIFHESMLWERACLFAGYVGMMERQLGRCVDYARERRQFGKPIGKNQAISHRLADMKLRLEAARLLLYRACWALDQGESVLLNVALSKLAISEAAIRSSLDAIQIFGGSGYNTNTGIEVALRDAIPSTIFSGTSEIQRELIAGELGL